MKKKIDSKRHPIANHRLSPAEMAEMLTDDTDELIEDPAPVRKKKAEAPEKIAMTETLQDTTPPGYNLIETKDGVPIKAWTKGVPIEQEAQRQLRNISQLPFVYKWVAAMPDVHWGIGATVGSVIPTKGAIIPAAVGVDIGCGVCAVQTTLNANNLPDNLHKLRECIELAVPHGRTHNGGPGDRGAWGTPPPRQLETWTVLKEGYDQIVAKHPKLNRGNDLNHLGTLGTGNHFIELCLDEANNVWIMLHSGSRGVGNRIGSYFIELAKLDMMRNLHNLPDKDLAYFMEGAVHFDDYVEAVSWAQNYARWNRKLMLEQIIDAMTQSEELPSFQTTNVAINCHHNYCIPASEKVPTPTGPKSIIDLKPGDQVYSFDSEKGLVETNIVKWMNSGKKQIFLIQTAHRKIRVSGEHPLLAIEITKSPHPTRPWHLKGTGNLVWKPAGEFKKGDILVCAKNFYSLSDQSMGQNFSRFIGAFLGDGWIRQKTNSGYTVGLAIGGPQEKVTLRYADIISKDLFPQANWFNNVKGAFGLTCSSKSVHSTILDLELGFSSGQRYLPNYCFRLPLEERKELIAGYLDADGCITPGGARLASRSERLVEGLRELAISCGFSCTNVRFNSRSSNFGPNPMYKFYINPISLRELELWHDIKQSRFKATAFPKSDGLELEKLGYLQLPQDIFAERVLRIDVSNDAEEVYDIEVDSPNHSFVCEGVVVHNCSREMHYGEEVFVTRKGAVRAGVGDMGIIPGSMGARSYIVRGKGNPESFHSCSHGAGRAMSRNEAKKRFTLEDHIRATAGVECRKDKDVIDETPAAYKDIDAVMHAQSDLVEVVHTLKQVLCVKG